jgi:predicted MPP superfamily phosphohydrolase
MVTETMVLRFRDVETSTVDAHLERVEATGAAWWAWWKKDSEEVPVSALLRLGARSPVDIGLINRQENARYVARCERVAVAESGERLSSPEPGRTPTYYRDDTFPAWFQLSSINRVTDPEWNRRFGGVPEGESTVFFVPLDEPDAAQQALQERFETTPIEVPTSTVLHISDLHFGSDYGFPLTSRSVPTLQRTLDDVLDEGMAKLAPEGIGFIVVSGDITTRGEPNGFLEARTFLDSLVERLGMRNDQVVLVPGNHDILLDEATVTRRYSAEQPFRDFLQLVYGVPDLELNRLHWFRSPADEQDFLVLALNSVRPRQATTMEYGYVGRDLYGPLVEKAGRLRNEIEGQSGKEPLMIAVLHHHVLPTPLVEEPEDKRPVSLTLDAGQLVEDLQAAGCHVVLHGHQHVPFVGSTSRAVRDVRGWSTGRTVHVVGGGSCSVNVTRLWDNMRNNSIGLYRPSDGSLDVRMYELAPTTDLREHMALRLPLG